MILRRLTQHVREQNWFAVALDFVIVVVGVFIGLQVSNWNDARSQIAEERVIVLRLIEEAQHSDEQIANAIAFAQNRQAAAVRAHQTLSRVGALSADDGQLEADLLAIGPWKNEAFVRATVDQIVSSGKITAIRSPEVQDAIARYRETIYERAHAFENLGSMNLDHVVTIRDRLDIQYTDGSARITTPREALLADEIVRRRTAQFIFVYGEMIAAHEASREINTEYSRVLARYARDREWLP